MYSIQNIEEYYDELFPVTTAQKRFYDELVKNYPDPVKILSLECGTGVFESILAREGFDVTGIESHADLLHAANMRKRNQLMSIRFFQMDYLDMSRFLGKSFYNVVSILDDRIMMIYDEMLLQKFFQDVRGLMTDGGSFVASLPNFDILQKGIPMQQLPTRASLRASLFTELWRQEDGQCFIKQNLETGNGKVLPVTEDERAYPLGSAQLRELALKAGFSSVELFADFEKNAFTGEEDGLVALLRA
ncbi:MAG: class I SAM-dependent methyltransferase [Treponema sp.]|nr:class I SAM-dependent methyltransferase [Treponema sp.]MBQ6568499.1 class I SAM-dependent methyltransferase [Treponema sp.]MBQ7166188.1 class I SAM-dependent methyltransferase [Treponema sp.]